MNDNIKETKLIIRTRNYNGAYGIGSIFRHEYLFTVQQLLNNDNSKDGLIKYSENIEFCGNKKLGSNPLATIRVEIPFLVTYDNLNKLNDLINEIKNNADYKYNESHYTKDRFDPKSLNYVDIVIDDEEFETDDKNILSKLNDVINFKDFSGLNADYYQRISDLCRKTNEPLYNDSSTKEQNVADEEAIIKIVNEVVGSNDMNKNRLLVNLTKKIINLPFDSETTIAQLMKLNNEAVSVVAPSTQGELFNSLMKVCKELNINIEVNHTERGGLGYHYKFKKINLTEKKKLIIPPFEEIKVELREQYIDENGHIREKTKDVILPADTTEDIL